jgi:hypothetical protein
MVERVKSWIAEGRQVAIFTARVAERSYSQSETSLLVSQIIGAERLPAEIVARERHLIEVWCERHIGQKLEVTCIKDFRCTELWDDIAVGVERNTGRRTDGKE